MCGTLWVHLFTHREEGTCGRLPVNKDNVCTVPACGRCVYARGLCNPHYQGALAGGALPRYADRACDHCGVAYTPLTSASRMCSRTCKGRAAYARTRTIDRVCVATHCVQCGKVLPVVRRSDMKFCDHGCGNMFHYTSAKAAREAHKTGGVL